MHLNYLYLLTVADISGTNPQLWNSWKDALIAELYKTTKQALRRGLENPIDKIERIQETKESTIKLIEQKVVGNSMLTALWDGLGDDYFIRYSPDEIAWHTIELTKTAKIKLPLIAIRETKVRGATEIFLYADDHNNIFSRTTRCLDNLGLNIVDARIITSTLGNTLDTFIVLEKTGLPVKGKERIREIRMGLKEQLLNLDKPLRKLSRLRSTKLQYFPIPTHVSFSDDETNLRTIMEVTTTDKPGVLSSIGMAMEFCGVSLQGAKITTYGERVEDIFFITTESGSMVTDELKLECLRNSISDSLSLKK